jgi:DNA-binding MarR family transcriptional regulator
MATETNRSAMSLFRVLSPIHQANRQASLHIDGLLADLSVTAQEGQLLAFISIRKGVPVTAIYRLLGVPKSTVTSLLKRFEKAGLTRRGSNPDDARSWLVFTTSKGRRIGALARERVLDLERRIQAHLAKADLDALARIVNAVTAETGIDLPAEAPWRRNSQGGR